MSFDGQEMTMQRSATQAAKLTIGIATRGRPHALKRCLDALLTGDVVPAEIIIVDQSEEEATARAVAEREDYDTPIVYIRQKETGLSASRNAAIAAASRSILAVTDDDCVPDSSWIAVVNQVFSAIDAPDAVTGRVLPLDNDGSDLHSVSLRSDVTRTDFRGKTIPWNVGTGGNFAVKREWFERIGYYDERLGAGSPGRAAEDADLLYRLLRAGAHIRYEPDAVIYHSQQDRNRRLSTRWGYGHGIGALCSLWLRRRDLYALRMLAAWLIGTSRELAGASLHREWFEAHQRLWGLGGTFQGLLYGMRVADNGRR
jgi:GT2 family glycosyltransferase